MISDHPWGTKQSHFVPTCLWSDNHWGTKQSHFVPLCLWSCLTTIEVLNSLILSDRVCEVVWQPLRYQTVSFCPIEFVELSDNHWGTKQSHFVPSCFWKNDNIWGTKQSHFVPSCLWTCLTTLEVLNSLTFSHRVCEVVWPPLMY